MGIDQGKIDPKKVQNGNKTSQIDSFLLKKQNNS